MRDLEKVEDRAKGSLPISIPTSLALEGLFGFGEYQDRPSQANKVDEIWVNLRTLFRNLNNSLEGEYKSLVSVESLLEAFKSEIDIFNISVALQSGDRIKVRYYYSSYQSFKKEFPHAKWKELNTTKQTMEQDIENRVIQAFRKAIPELWYEFELLDFNVKLKGDYKKVALLTHYSADLLWYKTFSKLYLLESHTGALKDRSMWYTKLTGGKQHQRIPFNKLTIQVFGDNNLVFSTMSIAIKRRLLEIAEKDSWTSTSTDERVRVSINKIVYSDEKAFFLSLLE